MQGFEEGPADFCFATLKPRENLPISVLEIRHCYDGYPESSINYLQRKYKTKEWSAGTVNMEGDLKMASNCT
jgi:hypothetical protein